MWAWWRKRRARRRPTPPATGRAAPVPPAWASAHTHLYDQTAVVRPYVRDRRRTRP